MRIVDALVPASDADKFGRIKESASPLQSILAQARAKVAAAEAKGEQGGGRRLARSHTIPAVHLPTFQPWPSHKWSPGSLRGRTQRLRCRAKWTRQ